MIRRLALVWMVVLAAGGCDAITDVARDLDLSLSTDRQTIRAGERFEIRYSATGASLVQVVIDPGDTSEIEVVQLFNAQTAEGHIFHTYPGPGTYEVVGVAQEFNGASRTARLTIVVGS
jgi:hypothetical protein